MIEPTSSVKSAASDAKVAVKVGESPRPVGKKNSKLQQKAQLQKRKKQGQYLRLAGAGFFLFLVYCYVEFYVTRVVTSHDILFLVVAAVIGGYVAMNIGANDVANNVGPAVGSKALGLVGAIIIAAIFEALGAIVAGGEVVSTVKNSIIRIDEINDNLRFVLLMMAALAAAGVWLNIATYFGAPVSTTHSIVGGILGAGIMVGGWQVVNWLAVGAIVSSWVISPIMGGVVAAGVLLLIKQSIFYAKDQIKAAQNVVPILVAFMAWAFGFYLLIKGTKRIIKLEFWQAGLISLVLAILVYIVSRPAVRGHFNRQQQGKPADVINRLFTLPLIFSAIILSFAHGANDVANAIGPLAAINDALLSHSVQGQASIPLWIMLIGAVGISLGLALFGPRLIKTVGSEITEINQIRAYCIAIAASLTVIIASQLGLPISSTHVAIGAIFGVGFLRELLNARYDETLDEVRQLYETEKGNLEAQAFLQRFAQADSEEKSLLLKDLKENGDKIIKKKHRKKLRQTHKERLVRRSIFLKVLAAWGITLPCSAALAAGFYWFFALIFI